MHLRTSRMIQTRVCGPAHTAWKPWTASTGGRIPSPIERGLCLKRRLDDRVLCVRPRLWWDVLATCY